MAPQQSDGTSEGTNSSVSFTINGCKYTVGSDVPPWTTLVDFIREKAHLSGTKVLCREAGCGICSVVVTSPDLEHPGSTKTYSVQSCQTLVYACDGWNIETVEGLGDRFDGYHPLQTALHGFAGTQCGYCSPGFIMTMYGQTENGPLTVSQVEKSLDGNLCRCTGYRPILDAFKSLAVDADKGLKDKLADIEDAYKGSCKKGQHGESCGGCDKIGGCKRSPKPQVIKPTTDLKISNAGVQWHRPVTLEGLYKVLKSLGTNGKVQLVVGNTALGVFKEDGPYDTYISTHAVPDLYTVKVESPVVLGANVTLTRAIEVFQQMAKSDSHFDHLHNIAKHWELVANVSVRNMCGWGGNLMMKHLHPGFQSDIFLTLLAAEAHLTVGNAADGKISTMGLEQFLKTDMDRKVILSLTLPPLPKNTNLRTFKITPRAVNAHAYVNACFRMQLEPKDGYKVVSKPLILLGGINPQFIHASKTEEFLTNQRLTDKDVVQKAIKILGDEVQPDNHFEDSSPQYRRALSQSLLFKTIVGFLGEEASSKVRSAGPNIERTISSGKQDFDMDKELWPVGEPIPKLESATQISGEARFLDDIQPPPNELHAAFVQSSAANAKIKSINADKALKVAGVVDWVTAEDIPGINNFFIMAAAFNPLTSGQDPVFASGRVNYVGQPIGLIVAEDRDTAVRAAKQVVVEYEDLKKPVLTIPEAMDAGRFTHTTKDMGIGDFKDTIGKSEHRLKGEAAFGTQYHLTMEPNSARVIPTEDGYEVFCTTQWASETQASTAMVLGVPLNSVHVSVRRLGGGYGMKISRANAAATAAAVAARKTKRPVRLVPDLTANMTFSGWREPYHCRYEVGFDSTGKLNALNIDFISDAGHVGNEPSSNFLIGGIQSTYYIPNFSYNAYVVTTDTAANTWCRAPGHPEATGAMENILERVAHYLKKDILEVQEINMVAPGVPRLMTPPHEKNVVVDDILPLLKEKASLSRRKQEVEAFNAANSWKKRGLSVVPMWYGHSYPPFFYGIHVSIYGLDGTVAISHSGVEMGQGLNTKVAQVAAYTLGIPLEKIVIRASDTMIGANSVATGGSMASDLCPHGVKVACTTLRERLKPVKDEMTEKDKKEPTWEALIQKALMIGVDLSERYGNPPSGFPKGYDIWGATALEVELDVLTGVYVIRRVDLIEDCGRSMSPYVDIGQVEGAFIMGLGLFTSELVKYNPETGKKLSDGTWEYKPPTALDIPADFRVTLLPNAKHPDGVFGSKATGEAPICMSYAIVSALRCAIASFRADQGQTEWFEMDTPITVEKAHLLCGVKPEHLQL